MIFLLDTCAAKSFCKNKYDKIDYTEIKSNIKNGVDYAVITPYSFYELIQGIRTPEEMVEMMRLYTFNGELFIFNINKLFPEISSSFFQTTSLMFDFKMHYIDGFETFKRERHFLGLKIFKSIFWKANFYCQLIAIFYCYLESFVNYGELNEQAKRKITFIDEYFANDNNAHFSQSFLVNYEINNESLHIDEYLKDTIKKMLTCAYVAVNCGKACEQYDTFNKAISDNFESVSSSYDKLPIDKLLKEVSKKTNNKINGSTIFKLFDNSFNKSRILEDAFEYILKKNGFSYSKMTNDFIDFCNITILEDIDDIAYITEDKKWMAFVLNEFDKRRKCGISTVFFDKYATKRFKEAVAKYRMSNV